MKKILFIDHSFHKKTKSSNFFKEIFSNNFIIEELWDDYWKGRKSISIDEINKINPDVVIFWQVPPLNFPLQSLRCKNIIFVPMEDAFFYPNYKWLLYKKYNVKILCFTKVIYNKVKKLDLNCFYIRYFLKPNIENFKKDYKKLRAIFWQRKNEINWSVIKKIIGDQKIEEFYFRNIPDPFQFFIRLPSDDDIKRYNIKFLNEWLTKEGLMNLYSQVNIFFASRLYEGIGLSFLEAMANGVIVIAPDTPSHNEYIQNGFNGYLYDYTNPSKIDFSNLETISKNLCQTAINYYSEWIVSQEKLINFIESEVSERKITKKETIAIFIGKISYMPNLIFKKFKNLFKKLLWMIFYNRHLS